MKNMGDILRQAQVMQNKLSKLQQEMAVREMEASSGGGMVKARVSGRQELLGITIDPKTLEGGDVDMLQDLILAAVNEAMRISRESTEREMNALTGGIRLPGVF
jgi:DNA-binding YbaB/EbfC family protein